MKQWALLADDLEFWLVKGDLRENFQFYCVPSGTGGRSCHTRDPTIFINEISVTYKYKNYANQILISQFHKIQNLHLLSTQNWSHVSRGVSRPNSHVPSYNSK